MDPSNENLGGRPKLPHPGKGVLFSPFVQDTAAIIVGNHAKPELAPHLYRRGQLPVFPSPISKRLEIMDQDYFRVWSERHFVTSRCSFDRAGNPRNEIFPMMESAARACLKNHEFQSLLPSIERVYPSPVPIIDSSGELKLCVPGYEPSTASFVFDSDFKSNSEYPNPSDGKIGSGGHYDDRMTLHEAVIFIYDLLHRFPFSDCEEIVPSEDSPFFDPEHPERTIRFSRSLAVQLMAMLAIFAGGCVSQKASRLAILYNANKQRSGKTLLAKIAIYPTFGSFRGGPWRESDDEMRKVLDGEILAATPYICFDNVRGLIASQNLESFMTTPTWTGRVLGSNEMFTGQNNALVLITGNNCSIGPDMQERVLISDLYVETADRQERDNEIADEHIISDVWLAEPGNRRNILSALWTIVRHWDAAGRPQATGKPRRGFESWCKVIGGMVEFAGFGDPLARPENLDNCGDSETDDFADLVRIASDGERHREATFQEVVHILWENDLLPWLINGREEYIEELGKISLKLDPATKSKLGRLLQRNCSGERGAIFAIRSADGTQRRIRVYRKGKGRARRFHFEEIPQ